MLIAMLMAGTTELAAAPLDGRRIPTGSTCFAIERSGASIGQTFQRVRRLRFAGQDALDIVVHQRVGRSFDMRDHFIVARRTLAPILFDSRRGATVDAPGWHRLSLRYSPGRITGSRLDASGRRPIDVALDHAVVDGNLWGITFAALPLRDGAAFTVPTWQYDKGFGTFSVRVVGVEKVTVGTRAEPAWAVEVRTGDGEVARYLIGQRPAELGYRAGPMAQRIGGDCSDLD
ncbi:hypothetical protein ABDK56_06535 [Sphingomonas sp. ASV193]|uniref:DUF3108 domain-containing protein n=1 Tax=Sphingomonas sp. ASV193 TaxID=3144405 RepID=UPI0032E8873C